MRTTLDGALVHVPRSAEVVTITDWEAIRERLGFADLDGQSPMTDRFAFLERAGKEAVPLTDGALREDNSTYELDYGFTADDVEWEVHWVDEGGTGGGPGDDGGEGVSGFALKLRDGVEVDGVRRAIDDQVGVLDGAQLDRAAELVTKGQVAVSGEAWATEPAVAELIAEDVESAYLHAGCIPFDEALGPDATVEDQAAVLAKHDIAALDDVDLVAISYVGDEATGWLPTPRDDLAERAALLQDWSITGGPIKGGSSAGVLSVGKAFGEPVIEGDRITMHVKDPIRAATVTFADVLPFGVCNDVRLLPEPTGL